MAAQLVGVNGTGQRKDYSTQRPILADTIATATKPLLLGSRAAAAAAAEFPAEDIPWDSFDQPEEETNSTLTMHNITTIQQDFHVYYNSSIAVDAVAAQKHRDTITNLTISNLLSKSHRRAMVRHFYYQFFTHLN